MTKRTDDGRGSPRRASRSHARANADLHDAQSKGSKRAHLVAVAALLAAGAAALVPRLLEPEARVGGAVGSATALAEANDVAGEPEARVEAPNLTPAPASETGAAATAAPAAPSDDLTTGLASDDAATKIAAVEAAVRRGDTGALAILGRVALAREPETAPTIIRAVASLAAVASSRERAAAVSTLSGWMREELRRDERDAAANVVSLVEALGDVGGGDAIAALKDTLDRHGLDVAAQTLVVEKLAASGDRSAEGAIARFARRVEGLPDGDDFDEELRREAMSTAKAALESFEN